MSEFIACQSCRDAFKTLLDDRIRRILDVGRQDAANSDESDEDADIGQSHCFHLMELKRILDGQMTCGMYDDYGPPLTIEGPLFQRETR